MNLIRMHGDIRGIRATLLGCKKVPSARATSPVYWTYSSDGESGTKVRSGSESMSRMSLRSRSISSEDED